jgi:serine/threonine protein kinase
MTTTAAQQHLERAYTRHIGTAEYMSPELLHPPPSEENDESRGGKDRDKGKEKGKPKQERFGYDARSSDIWSAGVFLCVVLLGAFPFEYSKKEVNSLEDAELDLWLQETARAWSDSPFLASNIKALPADARDLLDKIFEVDPSKRITVEGIRAHPWYSRPLREPELAAALEAQDAAQRAVDAHIEHRRLDTTKVAARVAALRELLREATEPPPSRLDEDASDDAATTQRRRINPLQQLDAGEHW